MEEKQLSAGFIVKNANGEFLACHCSGRKFSICTYDIPKGHVELGENDLEAAKRELFEETGIDINKINGKITDFGVQQYIKTKDLHIFMLEINEDIKTEDMNCTTYFEVDGKQIPEVNSYVWTNDISLFFKSLQNIFNRLKSEGKLKF